MRMVSEAQLQQSEDALIDRFVDQLFLDVRASFPQKLAGNSDAQLQADIKKTVMQVRHMGLKSKANSYHFVGICIYHGWDFLAQAENAWMHDQFLNNRQYGTLDARVRALFNHCYKQLSL